MNATRHRPAKPGQCEAGKITQTQCYRKAAFLRTTGTRNVALCKNCDERIGGIFGRPVGCDRCELDRATVRTETHNYCHDCAETEGVR